MEYLDFELEVAAGDTGDYVVSVLRSPAGEARASMHFPYDQLELRTKVQALQIALLRSGGPARRSPTTEDRSVAQFGRDLFGALFAGEVASRLEVTRSLAHQQGRGVRLKLRISAPELLGLPWEYLFDTDLGDYVALSVGTPLVRYVPLPQQIEPLEIVPPIRILGMTAGPKDLGELDANRERARLETALEDLRQRGVVELVWVPGETWEDLQEALWAGPWHVFHFVGHGGFNERLGLGVIYLADADAKARELSATDLARLLGDHDALRLAVLNSCDTAQGTQTDVFSSTAAALVRRGTPAVVAMQFEITDQAAIQFSRVFYRAIAIGMPVDAAVAEARKSIALQVANSLEWGTPVLFMRSPDGLLFKVPAATAAVAAAAASVVEPDAATAVAAASAGGDAAATPDTTAPAAAAPAGVAFAVECATGAELSLDAQRRGTASCTVRNLSGKRLRARLSVTPLQSAAANWFGIQGPSELVFEVGAEQPVTIDVAADAKAAAGSYAFRLDVASVANPDDEWANGPPTSFALSDPEDDHKKPFPWRWVAIGGGGLLALGASAVLAVVLLGGDGGIILPDVKDLRLAAAKEKITALCDEGESCLDFVVKKVAALDRSDVGRVVTTEPGPGEEIQPGSSVVLSIGAVLMIDVIGQPLDDAVASLEGMCAPQPCVTVRDETISTTDASLVGRVVQSDPLPGKEVDGTIVSLSIGAVFIPDLIGLPETAAREALEGLCEPGPCLKVTSVLRFVPTGDPGAGVVIEMAPALGTAVAPGSEVIITVGVSIPIFHFSFPPIPGFN